MKLSVLLLLVIFVGCSSYSSKCKKQEPTRAFTVTDGISHPESVLYSEKYKVIFVSNIASGNPLETKRVGYISKLTPDGKVIESKWVTGLRAPKGLAIVDDELYVSDINEVVKININTAKIIKTIKIKQAKFLNDVVADKKGNVYISDMNDNVIYIWNKSGIKDWIRSPDLRSPNGLFTDGSEHIIMVQWGSEVDGKTWIAKNQGSMMAIPIKNMNHKFEELGSIRGHLDGIDSDIKGNLWVSDWMSGDIWEVKKNGNAKKRFNFGPGTADISVAKGLGILLIPQMNQNKVIGIKLR